MSVLFKKFKYITYIFIVNKIMIGIHLKLTLVAKLVSNTF